MFKQPDINQQRTVLRAHLRQLRNSLSPMQQTTAARNLYRQVVEQGWFLRAKRMAFYLANDGEISPEPLLRAALQRGKQVYLPTVAPWPKKHMAFQPMLPDGQWEYNRYGIHQPRWNPQLQCPLWTLDLICLPLVGFDQSGGRLGMGGGYYDRALAPLYQRRHIPMPHLLGLAHACQEVAQLPLQAWDIPLHAVVTDQHYIQTDAQTG